MAIKSLWSRYSWLPSIALVLLIAASLGRLTQAREGASAPAPCVDTAYQAAVVSASYLRVKRLIETNRRQEALDALDAAQLLQLTLMREHDEKVLSRASYVDLRSLVVKRLQADWLANPPEYLDEESARFLEAQCKQLRDCKQGRAVGRRSLPTP